MKLEKLQKRLVYAFVVALIFPFWPMLALGDTANLNIEITAVQVVGVLLVAGAALSWRSLQALSIKKPYWIFATWISFSVASVVWSMSPGRSSVVALYMIFLWLIVASFVILLRRIGLQKITKLIVSGAIISSLVALFQFVAASLGVLDGVNGLLPQYSPVVFGFPRPQAFFAEPQYLASFMVFSLGFTVFMQKEWSRWLLRSVVALLWLTLWLTLSRGGFIAGAVLLVAMAIVQFWYEDLRRVALLHWVAAGASGLVALLFIGLSAQVYTKDKVGFWGAVESYVEHASISVIDIDLDSSDQPKATSGDTLDAKPPPSPTAETPVGGEVVGSRNDRVRASRQALSVVFESPKNALVGVGIGGYGPYVHAQNETLPENEVVNNQFLAVLAETGLLGLSLFIGFVGALCISLTGVARRASSEGRVAATILLILLGATHVQYFFFSTFTNATHLWFLYAVIFAFIFTKADHSDKHSGV